jgi:DNA-binding NtrC family response regulator
VPRATWQHSRDSSTVWAALAAMSVDAAYVDLNAIPWFLLRTVGQQNGPTSGDRLTQTRGGVDTANGLPQGLPQQMEHFERTVIVEELRRHKGDQPATAAALGIARQTLYDKLRKFGIAADGFRS